MSSGSVTDSYAAALKCSLKSPTLARGPVLSSASWGRTGESCSVLWVDMRVDLVLIVINKYWSRLKPNCVLGMSICTVFFCFLLFFVSTVGF
jgi:hypothetical protein